MTKQEYRKKNARFNTLFEKKYCKVPTITPDELREMFRLQVELCVYEQDQAFMRGVWSGEISPRS